MLRSNGGLEVFGEGPDGYKSEAGVLRGAYHIESNDMFKGDLARLVLLDEDLIDLDRRRARRQPQDEGVGCCRSKGFDPICRGVREARRGRRGWRGYTDDVLGNVR